MSNASTMKSGVAHKRRARRASSRAKWLAAAGAVVLAVGALIVLARPDGTPAPAAAAATAPAAAPGQLTALRGKYSFGTVSMAAGKVNHRYAISNIGTGPVVIRKLYTSCMCTTAALVKNGKSSDAFGMPGHTPIPAIDEPLAPTDQAYVDVVFDPAAHGPAGIGPIERVVTVENNAGEPLELQFSAMVTP